MNVVPGAMQFPVRGHKRTKKLNLCARAVNMYLFCSLFFLDVVGSIIFL